MPAAALSARCVVAPGGPVAGDWASQPLDSVRDLAARFPGAGLRPSTLVRAADLDRVADPAGATRVWMSLESLQTTGSFKVRGALVALDALRGRGPVLTASAGNHGAAVAHAARVLGVPATVVVPKGVPQAKRARIERAGAELVVAESEHFDDAQADALELAARRGATFVSAYDDRDVVLGNGASLGFEIVRALGRVPARICAPIGGGGLCAGLGWAMAAEAAEAGAAPPRTVWGAQSEASCAAARSLERGEAIERLATGGTTLAEGLEGGISASGFERVRAVLAGVMVVSEAALAAAMAFAFRDLGLVLEGSAAAALAAALGGLPEPMRGGDLVLVLTGRNVDPGRLERVTRGLA